jgi:beta-xylosidase
MHEILHSPDLVAWTTVSTVMNETGKVDFAVSQTPPFGACRTRLENVE